MEPAKTMQTYTVDRDLKMVGLFRNMDHSRPWVVYEESSMTIVATPDDGTRHGQKLLRHIL